MDIINDNKLVKSEITKPIMFTPHKYQSYVIDYIKSHPIAAVFLDMGLGKTVITLTAIADMLANNEINRVLVVAPLRVARDTWSSEIDKWRHLNHLTYAIAVGDVEERKNALNADVNITLINRENLDWMINNSGIKFKYDMVVIDELSSFKNYKSKRFRALMKVRPKVNRIIGLTGTPSSNGLMDLFAEFKLLDCGDRLGRFITHYRDDYFIPDKKRGKIVYSYKEKPYAKETIYKKISDITVSMKAIDYLNMPKLIISNHEVKLSDNEYTNYQELKNSCVLNLPEGKVTTENATSLIGKLCQLANGAIYSDNGNIVEIHNRKLDALEDIIEATNGKPLLVAYWFKHDLLRIKSRFSVREIKTSQDIIDWNSGNIPIAVIHPASAGHGLNLQAGGATLIWFGLTWSLELYQQTNARLYRQGQSSKTVVIQHIITKGTIDEQILQALLSKEISQNALINAVKANVQK